MQLKSKKLESNSLTCNVNFATESGNPSARWDNIETPKPTKDDNAKFIWKNLYNLLMTVETHLLALQPGIEQVEEAACDRLQAVTVKYRRRRGEQIGALGTGTVCNE